jgi:Rieske Fe-S protein
MSDVPRREFLKGAAAFGATCAVGGGLIAFGKSEYSPPAIPEPIITRGSENELVGVTAQQLAAMAATETTAFTAEWSFQPAVLYIVDPKILRASTLLRGIDTAQHAIALPGTDKLLLAYNGKCKHLGCTVGWAADLGASKDIEDYTGDGVKEGRVLCPCHQAQYDVYDLGTQVPKTLAPEPLDVIKIVWEGDRLMGVKAIAQDRPHAADGK